MAADAEFLDTFDRPHPSLCNIIENDSLKWIFVGKRFTYKVNFIN